MMGREESGRVVRERVKNEGERRICASTKQEVN